MQSIPLDESIIMGGDLNGHVGSTNDKYRTTHGGQGFGGRNEMGESILDFAVAYGLVISIALFQKKEECLITFRSGQSRSQIDFFLL